MFFPINPFDKLRIDCPEYIEGQSKTASFGSGSSEISKIPEYINRFLYLTSLTTFPYPL